MYQQLQTNPSPPASPRMYVHIYIRVGSGVNLSCSAVLPTSLHSTPHLHVPLKCIYYIGTFTSFILELVAPRKHLYDENFLQ